MRHSNSAQNPTDINLDASTLAAPIGEYRDVPSRSSCLIPDYMNLHISGLRRRKIIQKRYKKINGILKVFGLISLFTSVAMSVTKSILPETASLSTNLLHHERIFNSSPQNLPNFINPLVSNIEEVNDTFTFKEYSSQPDRLEFVEAIRKERVDCEN